MKKFFSKNKTLILAILFTCLALAIWRFGTLIKVPLFELDGQVDSSDVFGFLDIFTGGALSQFSILALGISPYITSSIVIQLLQMDIIPQFKEWAEEGESGRQKLNQWTRYIALLLAFVQSVALIIGMKNSNFNLYFSEYMADNALSYVYMALVMTAGSAFCMWLADQITMRGVGNGSSMIIVAGIVASFPGMFVDLYKEFFVSAEPTVANGIKFGVIVLLFLLIILGVVWMEGLQRKIPIQYANRPAAAQLRGKQDSNIPIKINSASVIPVIFASTILSLPLTIVGFTGSTNPWWERIFSYKEPIGSAIYVILIFVFAFFYAFLQINPDKMADNLKKQNAYILGVKPGEDTAVYISRVLFKVTLLGATYLTVLASLPMIITAIFGITSASVSIGGTSLMIVVGVAIETAKQLKTKSESQEYKGFL